MIVYHYIVIIFNITFVILINELNTVYYCLHSVIFVFMSIFCIYFPYLLINNICSL